MLRDRQSSLRSFRLLGLAVGASRREIRDAYLRLIKAWHPDLRRDDPQRAEETSKRLNAAFRQLKSLTPGELEELRVEVAASTAAAGGEATGLDLHRDRDREPTLAGFRPPVAARRRRATVLSFERRGRDVVGAVEISSREVAMGARWQFVLPTCVDCAGWGARLGERLHVCTACHGLGATGLPLSPGPLSICRRCRGRGCFYDRECPGCGGSGESGHYVVRCRLAAGVGRGFLGVLDGLGHPGTRGGDAGDLYLAITGQPASRCSRQGSQ